jgi:hypothetical protein
MTAKLESSLFRKLWLTWTPAFAAVTTFYESIKVIFGYSVAGGRTKRFMGPSKIQ